MRRKSSSTKRRLPEHKGFQIFCEKTSIHGFAELYSADTLFWKLFWLSVCVGACGITFYQVHESVSQFITQPTAVTVVSVDEDQMLYAPFRLCYWQWYYWVDWDKVLTNHYDKDGLLYGFAFFASQFIENTNFTKPSAHKKFVQIMRSTNFTRLSLFYSSIARSVPINDLGKKNFTAYFDENEIIYNPNTHNVLFCYKISQARLRDYFADNPNDKTIYFETFDETYKNVARMLTETEYTQYIINWVENRNIYKIDTNIRKNMLNFAPPITLMLSGNVAKALEISMDNDEYMVDVRASVFTRLNKPERKCSHKFASIANNNTCEELCNATVFAKKCNCVHLGQAVLIKNDTSRMPFCNRDINFIIHNSTDNVTVQNYIPLKLQEFNDSTIFNDISNCVHQNCVIACEIWTYEKSVTIKTTSDRLKLYATKNSTQVSIEYPKGQDVIIITEINAQSWETFIGNVGGILGIWTGASIVSFVQLVYLCFCAADEHHPSRLCMLCFGMTKKVLSCNKEEIIEVPVRSARRHSICSVDQKRDEVTERQDK